MIELSQLKKGDEIMLEITSPGGNVTTIGTWTIPGAKNDNFRAQEELGWHIMLALYEGAAKIEIKPNNWPDQDVEVE